MKNKSIKRLILSIFLILSMISYVGWVFYISEPTYVDHAQSYNQEYPAGGETALYPLHTYDFVVVPRFNDGKYATDGFNEVKTGLVLQVDNKHALVKLINQYRSDEYVDLILDKSHYRIIGRGTIYHKINHYIGFNIMLVTQVIIGFLTAMLCYVTASVTLAENKEYSYSA